jgi:hypothetical protein
VPATYITQAELRALLNITGITLYTDASVEEVCQASEDILKKYLWFDKFFAVAQSMKSNVATLYFDNAVSLYVGETIVVTDAGAKYNGSKTVASIPDSYSITYTVTGQATDEPKHRLQPPATVSAVTHVDYATTPAVRQAAAALATTIWQARQAPGASVTTIDGFIASPYQLGNTLIAKVRGLIAPYMSPNSMVG